MADTDPDPRQDISDVFYQMPFTSPARGAGLCEPSSPILVREILALPLLVILCDVTLYRSEGFLGPGVLFLIAPLLVALGKVGLKPDRSLMVLAPMLLLVSARLAWCGSYMAIATGFVLLCCFAMGLSGLRPYLTRAIVFASQMIVTGYRGLHQYFRTVSRFSPSIMRRHWFAVGLPVMTLMTFGSIFVMANPDLVKSFGQSLTHFLEMIERWMQHFQLTEILFCLGAAWIVTGLLRPDGNAVETLEQSERDAKESAKSPYYDAYRNTLVVVIGLFAVYLTFEFQTLWFQTFPQGFHYSGYAHEGAAWLTVALGLATIMLSLIFRSTILADPRLSRLRVLSWIWSIENLLLAVAVFNRLFIYIGFNGMTRMRVVGMLGVASVVGGFLLVLRKIARNRDFTWLIRRQLWTVAFAIYLYAVLPVDGFVNQFNVNRILAGDPRPSVQISVHPTSDEGWLCLKPLIDCDDSLIRDGVRGLLDEKLEEIERTMSLLPHRGWTARQIAFSRLFDQLHLAKSQWTTDPWWNDTDDRARRDVITRFREYAYQWY
jgi:hypothetical protein